jgi:hypothetical protein
LAEEEEVNANNWIGTGLRPLARTGHCYLLLPVFVLDGIDADTAIGPAPSNRGFRPDLLARNVLALHDPRSRDQDQ